MKKNLRFAGLRVHKESTTASIPLTRPCKNHYTAGGARALPWLGTF
jgi:hypothetical protein